MESKVHSWPFSRYLNRTDLICKIFLMRSADSMKIQLLPDVRTAIFSALLLSGAGSCLTSPSLPCHKLSLKRQTNNFFEKGGYPPLMGQSILVKWPFYSRYYHSQVNLMAIGVEHFRPWIQGLMDLLAILAAHPPLRKYDFPFL